MKEFDPYKKPTPPDQDESLGRLKPAEDPEEMTEWPWDEGDSTPSIFIHLPKAVEPVEDDDVWAAGWSWGDCD